MEHSEHTSTGRTAKGVRTPLDSLDEDVSKRRQKAAKATFPRIELASDAPKPNLDNLIAKNGAEPTALALSAWDARLREMFGTHRLIGRGCI
jgi:hypothetical protein